MKQIQCRFCDVLIAPVNALDSSVKEYVTKDGVNARAEWRCVWDNKDGRYEEELEDECQRAYGRPFSYIRSMWIARLAYCDEHWCKVKLIKI